MKTIALIYMGGTFGCTGDPLRPMPADVFIPQLQKILPHHMQTECFIAPSIKDSSACTAVDWLQLIQFMQKLQQQGYQHFVIIHGTDTLSYAAAVLSHFMASSAHVVLTGSQYPLLNVEGNAVRELTDALDNLSFALVSAASCKTGVYLAFHQKLLHARTALKQHTTDLDAFSGTDASEIPPYAPGTAVTVQQQHIDQAQQFNCLNLMMQPIDLKQQLHNLQQICHSPPDCLILQGFGIGNLAVSPELLDVLQQIQNRGCAVILSTQVPYGKVDQRYAISAWVKNAGILTSSCAGHADLYAKALKMYLQYPRAAEWHAHWYDQT